MLDVLREWNWGIKVILGLVILSFVIFFAGNFADVDNTNSQYIARVGKDKIDNVEFQNTYQMLKKQQQQYYGNENESNPQLDTFFRQQAAQSLVDRKLMLREAKKAGIIATEKEIQETIEEYPFFTDKNGQFVSMDIYQRIIDMNFHMDVPTFEKAVAEDIIINKFNDYITAGMLVTDKEVEEQYRKTNLTAKIDYVLFESKSETGEIQVKPEDLRAYYDSHKQDFQTGELRKVQYLWISHDSEKNKVQITPERLKQHYDANISKYSRPEQVHARHILLKIGEGKNEEAVKKQAEDLVKQLRSGADFAALAKEFSEDPGSKENGGDLGFFDRGRMVPEFANAAFSQLPNQIGDPVKTQYGYHIIETLQKQAAYTMDFALVKDQIFRELSSPQAVKNAQEQAKKIYDEVTKNKKSMNEVSKIQLVELKTTGFFGQHEDLPGLSPAFRDKAFELKKGAMSEPVQVFQDFAMLQLLDTKPSEVPPFEKVEVKVTQKYRQWKAEEQAREQAQQFYQAASAGTDFKASADKMKLTLKSSEAFTKGGYVSDLGNIPDISEKSFTMKVNEINKPVKVNQNYAVFQLKEKKEFDPAAFQKEKEQLRQQMASQKYGVFLQGYRNLLRKRYEKEIWINEEVVSPKQT